MDDLSLLKGWYTLKDDGKTPIRMESLEDMRNLTREKKTVEKTTVGDVNISTVFLGLDHSFNGGDPVLWETMIFGGEHDGDQWRYSRYDAAVVGHRKAVGLVHSN